MKKSLTDYVNEIKIKQLKKELMDREIDGAKSLSEIKKIMKKYIS